MNQARFYLKSRMWVMINAESNLVQIYQWSKITLGISQGGLGNIEASKETIQSFVDNNPKHPLAADAKQVIVEL